MKGTLYIGGKPFRGVLGIEPDNSEYFETGAECKGVLIVMQVTPPGALQDFCEKIHAQMDKKFQKMQSEYRRALLVTVDEQHNRYAQALRRKLRKHWRKA